MTIYFFVISYCLQKKWRRSEEIDVSLLTPTHLCPKGDRQSISYPSHGHHTYENFEEGDDTCSEMCASAITLTRAGVTLPDSSLIEASEKAHSHGVPTGGGGPWERQNLHTSVRTRRVEKSQNYLNLYEFCEAFIRKGRLTQSYLIVPKIIEIIFPVLLCKIFYFITLIFFLPLFFVCFFCYLELQRNVRFLVVQLRGMTCPTFVYVCAS